MAVHIPMTFVATAGAAVREINCEHCSCRFSYRLIRRGEGRAYGHGDGPREAAGRSAQRDLERHLEHDQDPVACPGCHKLQAEMVRQQHHVRASRLHVIQSAACMMLLVGGLLLLARLAEVSDMFHEPISLGGPSPLKTWGYTLLAGSVLVFIIYYLLRRLRDRFLDDPKGRRAPFGVPKPWRKSESPPSIHGITSGANSDGWIQVQLLDLQWPAVCCGCLTPTEQMKQVGPLYNDLTARVPWCRGCQQKALMAKCGAATVAGMIGGTAMALLMLMDKPGDTTGILMFFAVGFVCFAILGWEWFEQFRKPVRFRRFHALRNTADIRVVNNAYRDLLIRNNP